MPNTPLITPVDAVKTQPYGSYFLAQTVSTTPSPATSPSASLHPQKLLDPNTIPASSTAAHRPSLSGRSDVSFSATAPRPGFLQRTKETLYTNRGLFMILLAQFFGSLMSLTARLLETGPQKFHALQILFVRQSITAAGCFLWMWWNQVPHAPFGAKEIRWLLVARGFAGFFGVFGLYYSLTYLDLADATVITFLAPIVATWACSVIPALREPFTKHEFFAGVVSLLGVVLIARPASLFSRGGSVPASIIPENNGTAVATTSQQGGGELVTPHQRLIAVLWALVGVLGAATAYTTIRWIGKRAHPLITTNYFASWCAIVSLCSLLLLPQVGGIIIPATAYQWALLGGIGISGFCMQFLLTSGLQLEKAGRGTNMVYSQMLFALFWERMVWGTSPGVLSLMGSGLILGSAIWVGTRKAQKVAVVKTGDEEVGLMNDPPRRSNESTVRDESTVGDESTVREMDEFVSLSDSEERRT